MEKKIRNLKDQGVLTDNAFFSVMEIINETKAELMDMVSTWELGIDPSDRTLYSLALRRAMDVITGTSAVDNSDEEG